MLNTQYLLQFFKIIFYMTEITEISIERMTILFWIFENKKPFLVLEFQDICDGLETSPCMDAFIQLEKALYCIQQCEIPQILLKISQAGIFTDKSKLQSFLKHVLETAMKRPLAVQYYARLCVQLFMKTQFINKDFDFKDYTAKFVFEEASKERDLYRLSFLIQFLYWIKIYGGFTDFYITTMIQKYTSSKSLSFMATMFFFAIFALDLHKNQPLLFLSLKKSYETAASNKILPQVLLQFENYFQDFSSIAMIYSDSFIQALVEDDIEKFTSLCASPFFDPNMKAPFSVLFTPKYPVDCPHLIDCAALCGSEKCFRFILMSMRPISGKDLDSLARCAVAGGSIPIIRLCIQHGCSLYHLIEVAAEYHRVDILYWMLTFEQSEQSLSAAFEIASRTNDVLSFFVLYSQTGILHGKPIHSAARHASIDILKLIRHAEIPINIQDFDSTGMSPLHHAVLSGSIHAWRLFLPWDTTSWRRTTPDTPR